MKKILVPIDYSTYSDNAVRHAIEIARKIHADIHLFHVMEAHSPDLQSYIQQLDPSNLPTITSSIETGSVMQVIDKLTAEAHFDIVVMGLAGAGKLNRFFLGSNSRKVIEQAKIPVLLVPKEAVYEPLKKIAFATDLSESDLNSIYAIARLFCLFDPEILLVHVDNQLSDFHDPHTPANLFLNRVTCKLNYSKIYYRHIIASSVEDGLKWVSENGQIDVISMIHRHSSIFARLLDGSCTLKLSDTLHIPLLVMPEDKTPIGW